jgi:hypothetical protein
MKSKKLWLGMLVMALVFGMTVVGCDNSSTDGDADTALNGTWVSENHGETTIKNGSYEFIPYSGAFVERGTYTVNGNIIAFTQTSPGNMIYTAVYYPNEKKYVLGGVTTFTRK